MMSLRRLLSKGLGMAIKRTNLQAGLCDANAVRVTQDHQILEGNEDSYSCMLPRATVESMTYEAKVVPKTTFSWGIWFLLLGRKISHGGQINPQLPTGGRRETCANSARKQVWDRGDYLLQFVIADVFSYIPSFPSLRRKTVTHRQVLQQTPIPCFVQKRRFEPQNLSYRMAVEYSWTALEPCSCFLHCRFKTASRCWKRHLNSVCVTVNQPQPFQALWIQTQQKMPWL